MSVQPSRVVDLTVYRSDRSRDRARAERSQARTLARRLIAEAIHIEVPEWSEPSAYFLDDPMTLLVSPRLSDFEMALAAWGSALRVVSGRDDPSVRFTRSRLDQIAAVMGECPDLVLRDRMGQ